MWLREVSNSVSSIQTLQVTYEIQFNDNAYIEINNQRPTTITKKEDNIFTCTLLSTQEDFAIVHNMIKNSKSIQVNVHVKQYTHSTYTDIQSVDSIYRDINDNLSSINTNITSSKQVTIYTLI